MTVLIVTGPTDHLRAESKTAPQEPAHYPNAVDIIRNCAGRRIEFALPATTLYVDPHLLGSSTLYVLFHWVSGPACPTWPVKMTSIELAGATLNTMDIRTGLGRQVMRLNVGGTPPKPGPKQASHAPAPRERQQPWVEIKPKLEFEYTHPGLKDARTYILHFPNAPAGSNSRVEVHCNGDTGRRECTNRARGGDAFAGLYIGYNVSQTQLSISDTASTDPATEPGALLQFETRLRALITKLQQRP